MIAIVDYKAGNLTSVKLAFEALNVKAEITSDPRKILSAERVVFPGVGAAGAAMRTLNELGLPDTIKEVVNRGTPFLGICLGAQIVLTRSDEDGGVNGIGLIQGNNRRFTPSDRFDKVPQMGWNNVSIVRKHPVLDGVGDNSCFYFVHSYYPVPTDKSYVLGETRYADTTFASVIGKGSLVVTQFHPEKSGRIGLKLLDNFVSWKPER